MSDVKEKLCIAQPTPYNYNTVERRPSTVLLDPHVATHTITTPTPSSHRHRRRSSISIHSPPRSSHGYVETRRHRRRSSQTSTPRSPRDEYGFSIRTPSTPAGQANEYGMSALAPVNSDEYSYFAPQVSSARKEEEGEGKSVWTEDDLRGYYSYGVGSVGAAAGMGEQPGRSGQPRRESRVRFA
ncbi:hypothetical protein J3E74DRAFT_287743 [Bipolaris maydis]|nr:hypothetical protein J3E74DRAFT_287743 [Bipolaris maydis]